MEQKSIIEALIENPSFEAVKENGKTIFKYIAEDPDKIEMSISVNLNSAVSRFKIPSGVEGNSAKPYLIHDYNKIENANTFVDSLVELANELENTEWKTTKEYIELTLDSKNSKATSEIRKIFTSRLTDRMVDTDSISGITMGIFSACKDLFLNKFFEKNTPTMTGAYLLFFQMKSIDNPDIMKPLNNLGTNVNSYLLSSRDKEKFKDIVESQILLNKATERTSSPSI